MIKTNNSELQKQIELLKKYGVSNYTIENEKITINGGLYLRSLESADKDFLKDTTINGYLDLPSLKSADKDFLKNTTINGWLDLPSLQSADKDFLKNTTINGSLWLTSLQSADKDFLKNTTINGYLYLYSLQSADKDFLKDTVINGSLYLDSLSQEESKILRSNVKQLEKGYNEEKSYCFFDGILSKVTKVSVKNDITIYETPSDFVVSKLIEGKQYTAHGKTVKKAIQDLNFKVVAEKLKSEPIQENTLMTVKHYRLITGACDSGVRQWMTNNNIPFKIEDNETVEEKPITAKELLPLLEKSNAYGLDRFKELVNW